MSGKRRNNITSDADYAKLIEMTVNFAAANVPLNFSENLQMRARRFEMPGKFCSQKFL